MNDVILDAHKPHSKIALKISLVYAVFSLFWILFSDVIVLAIFKSPEHITQLQVLKGWLFVIVSSLIIYFLLRRENINSRQRQENFLDIVNSTTEAIFVHHANSGKIIDANQAASKLFGLSNDELKRRSITELNLAPKANVSSISKQLDSAPYIKQTKNNHHDNIWVEISQQLITNNTGTHVISTVRDISERKRSEDVLRTLAETGSIDNGDIFKTIVRQLASSIGMRYALIAILQPNDKTTVTTLAVWNGNDYGDNFSYPLDFTPCKDVTEQGMCTYPNNIQQLFPKDECLTEMDAQSYIGVPLKNKQDETIGLLALLDDKAMNERPYTIELLNSLAARASIEVERKQIDEQLKLSSRVFTDTHEGILITDVTGTIIDVNPTFCDVTEYSREEVIGKNPDILNSGQHDPKFYNDMWQEISSDGHWQGEVWNRKKSGELYVELLTISALTNDNNELINYVGIFTDITKSKKQQEQLELMAHYDVLTKLPNRILFADRFNQAIAHSKRTNTIVAVGFLDLDNFKPVNDNYGHIIGDQLLIEVAKRIQANIREEDTVSRQGGDEFAFFLVDLESPFQGEQMLERIQHAIAQPYLIEGHAISISASMGVTLYPYDDADLDTLLRHADQAMYHSKVKGKNNYHLFDLEDNQKIVHQHHRLHEIELALTNDELQLYYQPKVNMKTGKVFGVEALIRWLHPEKGLIPPIEFLPAIEGTELDIKVGNWVINQAMRQLAHWKKLGIELEISINISSLHLLSPTFFTHLGDTLTKYPDVDSKYLQMEILESSVLADVDAIQNCITICNTKYGIQFSLDDFGTGYSSLTHIRKLPAQTIKIDQSFIFDILDDPNDYTIVAGIIALAESFGRDIIAEGVETVEHGSMLLLMGCDNAQGYGIARPMPADDFILWLDNYTPNNAWMTYNDQTQTPVEKRVNLLHLIINQWVKQLTNHLNSKDDATVWMGLDQEKCHCSYWISRESKEHLFSKQWLNKLHHAHEKMHQIAQQLFHQGNEIDKDLARTNLDNMHSSINDVYAILAEFG